MHDGPEQTASGGGEEKSALSWSVLLAKWTQFAQSATALPEEGDMGRWKRSVSAVIGLQAVTFALGEINELARDERALALDRAGVLIDRHEEELDGVWGDARAEEIDELIGDARRALGMAGEVVEGNG